MNIERFRKQNIYIVITVAQVEIFNDNGFASRIFGVNYVDISHPTTTFKVVTKNPPRIPLNFPRNFPQITPESFTNNPDA